MFSQLLQPFEYLRINDPNKRAVDWLIPLIFTIPTVALLVFLQPKVNVYGDKGFIQGLTQFVQTLPGFYIAALAAIVTFSSGRMDDLIPEPTPTVQEMSRGRLNAIPLTRRRFLSMMFAFLTAESFLLVLLGIAGTTFAPTFKELITGRFQAITAAAFLVLYCYCFFQMLVATFWGLFYLGSRIHSATD